MTRRLVARLDNLGDVVLAGPAVRAVAASGGPVTFLAGPAGAPAARLLPGVDDIIVFDAPWVSFDPPSVEPGALVAFKQSVAERGIDEAVILTSFHQSPLPLALLLRTAGVRHVAATSVDYPGSLLDVRHPYLPELHEVEQSLSLCRAAGHVLPPGDDGRLRLDPTALVPSARPVTRGRRYVVVHPGASVPARGLPDRAATDAAAALAGAGFDVIVTGAPADTDAADRIVAASGSAHVHSTAGTTDVDGLVQIVAGADVVVTGNTGAAHVAAAVGTPVVEAFAPVVDPHRWRPWMVPHILLGDPDVACAGCRSRQCPIAGQPCLAPFTADAVLEAVELLTSPGTPMATGRAGVTG